MHKEIEEMNERHEWNILATAKPGYGRQLLDLLRPFGQFRWTRFWDVAIGYVPEPMSLLEEFRRQEETQPDKLEPISKLLPIDRVFDFSVETFEERLKDALLPYADRIDDGSFLIRIERRGHAGEIHSHNVEQHVGQALIDYLAANGHHATVDFEDPDYLLFAETLDDQCGIGMIDRRTRLRYPFLRIH
ncbi:MAG: hypothetical protein D6690_00810 [Nitrospirae bacterium]|nr:MAG: hypothetical protein D6690_00810 [Nitrospirota bacterium]